MIISNLRLLDHVIEIVVFAAGVYFFVLPLLLALWLWFRYDHPIKILRDAIDAVPQNMNEQARGRGVTAEGLRPHIDAVRRPLEIQLRSLETQRQVCLDRSKLILKFKLF